MPNVSQQLLETLKTQNGLLKSIDKGAKSMEARLGRMERQLQGCGNPRHRQVHPAPPAPPTVQHGSWKFVETQGGAAAATVAAASKQQILDCGWPNGEGRATFEQVVGEGLKLKADTWLPNCYRHPTISTDTREHSSERDTLGYYVPRWSNEYRQLLPQLQFNDQATLKLKSGIYALTVKYHMPRKRADSSREAAVIIGEIEFINTGYAVAEGADWDRLLTNQKQTQLPYSHNARGVPQWRNHKISEPWEDGDELKFQIDTNENTIVYQRGNTPKKTFWNVLAFTNNRKYPEFLHMYAFCVWWPLYIGNIVNDEALDHSLTIIP
jgi:hypothetical protein